MKGTFHRPLHLMRRLSILLIVLQLITGCGVFTGIVPQGREITPEEQEIMEEMARRQIERELGVFYSAVSEMTDGAAQEAVTLAEQIKEEQRIAEEERLAELEEQERLARLEHGLIVIDAGHQAHANTGQEPVGPGASETKAKVAGGTRGVSTGVPEHQLTLDITLLLREELLERGYEVILVRETSDVDISNSERAQIANEAGADAFVRIHANGSVNSGASGAMTICQTRGNPYNGELYEKSRRLSDCVLDAFVEATGARREYVWETDSMSGINWCKVPVTIVEVGYMTNPEEDRRMQDPDYQELMVEGLANGIDRYMEEKE